MPNNLNIPEWAQLLRTRPREHQARIRAMQERQTAQAQMFREAYANARGFATPNPQSVVRNHTTYGAINSPSLTGWSFFLPESTPELPSTFPQEDIDALIEFIVENSDGGILKANIRHYLSRHKGNSWKGITDYSFTEETPKTLGDQYEAFLKEEALWEEEGI